MQPGKIHLLKSFFTKRATMLEDFLLSHLTKLDNYLKIIFCSSKVSVPVNIVEVLSPKLPNGKLISTWYPIV
jgi:hypothetical protein